MDDTRERTRRSDPDSRTVSTPEGDNEFAPDQPLTPSDVESDVEGLQQWPSNSRMEYDKTRRTPEASGGQHDAKAHTEHDAHHAHKGLDYVIDEISTGKILP